MINSYTCVIHRPPAVPPNQLAVTCEGAERAMLHAERAAAECDDWQRIEVFLGSRRVAVREREEG